MRIKKILSIFLATALLLSTLTISVSAEELEVFGVEVEVETTTSTLSSTPIIYNAGDEITVKLVASQNTGITSVNLMIDYDENALEVVDYSAMGLFTSSEVFTHYVENNGNGYFRFYFFDYPNKLTETGVFAEITFVAKQACVNDSTLDVSLFNGNENNCLVFDDEGRRLVPFESNSDVFSIHNIDKTSGVVTEPTCTEIGYTTYECPGCEEAVIGNLVDAKGHTEAEPVVENRVEPTCLENGSYDSVIYCSVCDAELSRVGHVIDARGHKLVPHEAKAPTCTEKGWDAYDTCSRCDYTTYVEKAALGHKYGETTVVEPTYKAEGYSTHTCTVCQHEEKFDIVPALTYILGDIDGDEEITDADAEYLLMHTFFAEEYPVNQTCDFNGDGQVNDADAEYLLMYTFFPEDYPLS